VSGIVTDADTGAAIAGAQCSLTGVNDYTSVTDQNGEFQFFNVLEGTYVFECTSSGYKLFSMTFAIQGSNPNLSIGTVSLEFNYCTSNPPCSGQGHCDTTGNCVCDAGWTGPGCADSILSPECANHRGFTEDVLDDILVTSALNKNKVKLNNLLNSLSEIGNDLPQYLGNSCCPGNNGYTYPVDLSSISTSSYAFLQNLMTFNEDSQAFLNEIK